MSKFRTNHDVNMVELAMGMCLLWQLRECLEVRYRRVI